MNQGVLNVGTQPKIYGHSFMVRDNSQLSSSAPNWYRGKRQTAQASAGEGEKFFLCYRGLSITQRAPEFKPVFQSSPAPSEAPR